MTLRVKQAFLDGWFSLPDYAGRTDYITNADLSTVAGVPQKYWKVVNRTLLPFTAQEQTDYEAEIALEALTNSRASAVDKIDGLDGVELRAIAGILLDEVNDPRQWITNFKIQAAAASNFTDLKTRIASLPNLPDRTLAQARTAYKNKVNADAGN